MEQTQTVRDNDAAAAAREEILRARLRACKDARQATEQQLAAETHAKEGVQQALAEAEAQRGNQLQQQLSALRSEAADAVSEAAGQAQHLRAALEAQRASYARIARLY